MFVLDVGTYVRTHPCICGIIVTTPFQDIHTLIMGKALTGIQAFVN